MFSLVPDVWISVHTLGLLFYSCPCAGSYTEINPLKGVQAAHEAEGVMLNLCQLIIKQHQGVELLLGTLKCWQRHDRTSSIWIQPWNTCLADCILCSDETVIKNCWLKLAEACVRLCASLRRSRNHVQVLQTGTGRVMELSCDVVMLHCDSVC